MYLGKDFRNEPFYMLNLQYFRKILIVQAFLKLTPLSSFQVGTQIIKNLILYKYLCIKIAVQMNETSRELNLLLLFSFFFLEVEKKARRHQMTCLKPLRKFTKSVASDFLTMTLAMELCLLMDSIQEKKTA